MRLTAFAVAYTTRIAHMIQPSVVKSKSSGRVHESIVDTCTQLIARIANSSATSDDAERLPALAQAEIPAGAHAEVVVDEARRTRARR